MKSNQTFIKEFATSIVAGILIGTSYIPFPPWAMFFCFVPLWKYWMEAESGKDVFIAGWITNFILTFIGFNWVAHTLHEYGHLPWPVAVGGMLAFCSFASLNIPIAGWIWFKLFRQGPRLMQICALVVLQSFGERFYPMIFDWHLGYTWLWIGWPAFQLADIVGFTGLSTITFAFNGLSLWAYLSWREKRPFVPQIAAIAVLLIALTIAGVFEGRAVTPPDRSARVLIVQANISNNDKEYAQHGGGTAQFIIDKFLELTGRALASETQPVTFALWPETAFPEVLAPQAMHKRYQTQLQTFLQQKQLALITGSYSFAQHKLSNAMTALDQSGQIACPSYSKTHLLAFGEYLPGSVWFPKMKEWVPEVSDFGRGGGPQILALGGMKLGAQICYEGLFDSFSRGLAQQGAQIIVNSTNDSWYPDWNEPYQHLYMTLARAVETRRPLVRSTNTGISTAILASGEILPFSPRGQEWTHVFDIPYLENPPQPPFLTWGFYLFPVILGLSFATLLVWRFWIWRPK